MPGWRRNGIRACKRRRGRPGTGPPSWSGSDWARHLIHHPDFAFPKRWPPIPRTAISTCCPRPAARASAGGRWRFWSSALPRRLAGAADAGRPEQRAMRWASTQAVGFELLHARPAGVFGLYGQAAGAGDRETAVFLSKPAADGHFELACQRRRRRHRCLMPPMFHSTPVTISDIVRDSVAMPRWALPASLGPAPTHCRASDVRAAVYARSRWRSRPYRCIWCRRQTARESKFEPSPPPEKSNSGKSQKQNVEHNRRRAVMSFNSARRTAGPRQGPDRNSGTKDGSASPTARRDLDNQDPAEPPALTAIEAESQVPASSCRRQSAEP